MEGTTHVGLRKGAWTFEEDMILKKYIENYGEGKWHLVPLKAGLNRCRKSCRLRWLNYLRPNIKRGDFGQDEVDLIVRLHKLLGNRWALIAGRIPGRTANDIKNYWNTHLRKNTRDKPEKLNYQESTTIIKPQAHTLTKNLHLLSDNIPRTQEDTLNNDTLSPSTLGEGFNEFLDDLFSEYEKINDGQVGWSVDDSTTVQEKGEGSKNGLSGLSIDGDLWDYRWTFD